MLVRFIVKNLFSFQDYTELNLLPGRYNRHSHHLYKYGKIDLLKLNVMYGANGAGKSNLIRSLSLLKDYLVTGKLPIEFLVETFKFQDDHEHAPIYLGVEFIKDDTPFYYGITIKEGIVLEEELEISSLGKGSNTPLFTRKIGDNLSDIQLDFFDHLSSDKEAAIFPTFLKKEILKLNEPVLFHMRNRQSEVFDPYKKALDWFRYDLVPISPATRSSGIALQLENDPHFYEFANETMATFQTGIKSIKVDTIPVEQFFGEDERGKAERISAELRANPEKRAQIMTAHEEIVFVLKDEKAVAKRLVFVHDEGGKEMPFFSDEESDGTRRLLDYLPAIYIAIHARKVYLIDEIERSIHPLLIKELLRKFSHNVFSQGQLIFSTHESNLLDQDIFRPDEIWFAEKNKLGGTIVYPLSDFKEHHTLDIRKGYLNGRYGAIPFLGNLKDLNWE